MELLLERRSFTDEATEGLLYVDGDHFCYTLEDCVRSGAKVYGKTAIPEGRYRVLLTHSPKFGRPLPLLIDVPGFNGIRIHRGNSAKDTLGCPLVGDDPTELRDNWISRSADAERRLVAEIEAAIKRGEEVWITVTRAPEAGVKCAANT